MVDTNKLGLVVGVLAGGVHLVWSLIVLLGWGQPLISFIFWAHMITAPVIVLPFSFTAAISVILVTAALGYLVGCVLGTIWNKVYVPRS